MAQEQRPQQPVSTEPWVIEIPDVGEIEFPASMSEDQVAQASQRLYQDAQMSKAFGYDVRFASSPPASNVVGKLAPFAGGVLGGIAGTAAGGPVVGVAGAGAGAAVGQAVKAGLEGRQPTGGELAKVGAGGALGQGVGQYVVGPAVGAAGKFVTDKALPLVRSAIKPTVTALKQQAGAAMTGLDAQANRIANIILKNKWTKADQPMAAVQQAEQQLQSILGGAKNVALDTAERIPRYIGQLVRSSERKIAPGSDPAAIKAVGQNVLKGPLAEDVVTSTMQPSPSGLVDAYGKPVLAPVHQTTRAMRTDVTPAEGLAAARQQGRWDNRKAWGELKGAEQEASKAVERATRDSVKEAVPAARPILQKQGEALKAAPVLDRMAMREANRDQIGLPAWVMASGGGGAARTLGAALANYMRNNQLSMGVRAADLGPALMQAAGRTGQISGEALKAALIALLTESGSGTPTSGPPAQ